MWKSLECKEQISKNSNGDGTDQWSHTIKLMMMTMITMIVMVWAITSKGKDIKNQRGLLLVQEVRSINDLFRPHNCIRLIVSFMVVQVFFQQVGSQGVVLVI